MCEHCGRFQHTKDVCWDLHGHPQQDSQSRPHRGLTGGRSGFRTQSRSNAHSITSSTKPVYFSHISDSTFFTRDQVDALHHFVASLDPCASAAPKTLFAQSGTRASAFSMSLSTSSPP